MMREGIRIPETARASKTNPETLVSISQVVEYAQLANDDEDGIKSLALLRRTCDARDRIVGSVFLRFSLVGSRTA
jgi:hypothetical protein